jgi:hypothetical protein
MRPVLALKVPEEAAQGDLVVREVMEVEVVKENLAVAVARELTVEAKEDTAVAREAMAVAVKAVAEEADEEGRGEKLKEEFQR